MRRVLSLIVLLAAAGVSAADSKSGTVSEFASAFGVAQAEVPNGRLVRARAEGNGVMGFYFWWDGRIVEIEVKNKRVTKKKDARDPKDVKDVNPDVAALVTKLGRSKIPMGRILEIAGKELKDTEFADINYETIGEDTFATFGDLGVNTITGEVRPNVNRYRRQ